MSLLLFMVGVAAFYYLYVAYFNKPNEKLENNEEIVNYSALDSGGGGVHEIRSSLRRFVLSIADPANNNYVDGFQAKPNPFLFRSFADRFQSFQDVSNAMKEAGLGRSRLILGIDFTASNEWQGRSTHKGHSLHNTGSSRIHSPYQDVISALQHTLQDFVVINDDRIRLNNIENHSKKSLTGIPAFGFGDTLTRDHSTFPLRSDGLPCTNFEDVLGCYKECVRTRLLSGPTSYAPVIHKAIEIVEQSNQYHILVIIADGQFVNKGPTMQAIVAASHYPLSIVVVGVGDGPWNTMHQFDDWLPQRQFDNFQFVEYEKIARSTSSKHFKAQLALHILMEIPDQYKIAHKLGYIENTHTLHKKLKL